MPVVIPHTFVGGPGNKAKASEVNANFAALAGKFTTGAGGIGDDDFTESTARRLSGTKISQIPGLRVPTASIEDEAITDAKLAFDVASPGADSGRAVSGDHIKTITGAHLARVLPANAIGSDKMGDTIVKANFGPVAVVASFATAAVTGGTPSAIQSFAKATYDVVGLYISGDIASGGANWVAQPLIGEGGANYNFGFYAYAPGAGSYSGTLVAVFRKKVTV